MSKWARIVRKKFIEKSIMQEKNRKKCIVAQKGSNASAKDSTVKSNKT